ncbi:MAG: hypothetical protein KC561_15435 [Myxococcales bacterium]|nr:hypothetical protein [Myxococcales bacterium]
MGVLRLTRQGWLWLLAGSITACASVANPVLTVPTEPEPICIPVEGLPDSTVLVRVTIPDHDVEDAAVALVIRRTDADPLTVALSDLPEGRSPSFVDGPYPAGFVVRYDCALVTEDTVLRATRREVTVPTPEAQLDAPAVDVVDGWVSVNWPEQGSSVIVSRRDVLAPDQEVLHSPALGRGPWNDQSVRSGGVYAYSIRAVSQVSGIRWLGSPSSERFVEVP